MAILVSSITPVCDTHEHGEMVLSEIVAGLSKADDRLELDFTGISNATSSFVNVAFLGLLDYFEPIEIKTRLKLVGVSRQIADMVNLRLSSKLAQRL